MCALAVSSTWGRAAAIAPDPGEHIWRNDILAIPMGGTGRKHRVRGVTAFGLGQKNHQNRRKQPLHRASAGRFERQGHGDSPDVIPVLSRPTVTGRCRSKFGITSHTSVLIQGLPDIASNIPIKSRRGRACGERVLWGRPQCGSAQPPLRPGWQQGGAGCCRRARREGWRCASRLADHASRSC
jgi:hypothetical protein